MPVISRFLTDESGTSSTKYGLIAACISLAIVTVMHGVGGRLRETLLADEWQPDNR